MKLHSRAPLGTRIEETEQLVLRIGDEIRKIIPAEELDRIQDQIGVPLFFNLSLVPSDNISGMDAEIYILLKKPHRPVAHYMREIRAKIPRRSSRFQLLLPERRHRPRCSTRPAGAIDAGPGRQLRARPEASRW
jgi:hypothetical protein